MSKKEMKSLFLHTRPGLYTYTLLGFLFGLFITKVPFNTTIILAFVSWLLLASGATVFNSYYDKDKIPLPNLKNPPKPTKFLLHGSITLKILGFLIAIIFTNLIFSSLYFLGTLASILYSHKKTRLKSSGIIALFTNCATGSATFFVAASLENNLLATESILGTLSAGFFLGSVYLMMQIHEVKDDKRRGDISIAVKHGKVPALWLSILFLIISAILTIFAFKIILLNQYLIYLINLYFISIIILLIYWIKSNHSNIHDYKIMSIITNSMSSLGSTILLILYILQNL